MSTEIIERQARLLAGDNKRAEPDIQKVYWFPDENEVRLIGLIPTVPRSEDDEVRPFYFRPSPQDDLPAPSGIALIRPDEFRKLRLPKKWGDWDRAILLENGR